MTVTLWEFFVAFSLLYFLAINLYYTLLLGFSFVSGRDRVREVDITNFEIFSVSHLTPPVSILIPAHNEESVIVNSVFAALSLNYIEYEVIIINDRSTDRTLRKLIETFELVGHHFPHRALIPTMPIRRVYRLKKYDNLLVVDKERGGKADALNVGLNIAKYPYICNTDADTIFEKDALSKIMRPIMLDPKRVVAVGGQVRVGNGFLVTEGDIVERRLPLQLLPLIQLVEYLRTFIGNRVGWSRINGMLLISGAFGCWQRHTLVSVGGFSTEVTGEDLEVTLRIHRILRLRGEDYRILSLPDPVCWTEVPVDLATFEKQRNRWHRVLLESFAVHRNMLLNPFYGVPGMLGMPTYFFFEILGPFVEFFSYFIVIAGLLAGLIDVNLLIAFLLFAVFFTTILNMIAIAIEDINYHTYNLQEVITLIFVGILENLGYRQYTMLIRIRATFDWLWNVKSWGSMARMGTANRETDQDNPEGVTSHQSHNPVPTAPSTSPDQSPAPTTPPPDPLGKRGISGQQTTAKNTWKIPAEIESHAPCQVLLCRIALTMLIFSLPYGLFVALSRYTFSPSLQILSVGFPEVASRNQGASTLTMQVQNSGRFATGAAYLVAVLDGTIEKEGPVIEIPPGGVATLPVRVSADPGTHLLTLVLFDAWKENVRADSREGLVFKVKE